MAIQSGIPMVVTLDDSGDSPRIISADVVSLDFSTPINSEEIQGVDKTGIQRLSLLADFSATLSCKFDDTAVTNAWNVLKDASSVIQERDLSIAISGQTLDVDVVVTDTQFSRGADGSFNITSPLSMGDGVPAVWS